MVTLKEIIYNYIERETVLKRAEEDIDCEFNNDTINFVTVARLVPQKAIDRLIKVILLSSWIQSA